MREIKRWLALVLTVGLITGSVIYQLGTYMTANELGGDEPDQPVATQEDADIDAPEDKVEVVEEPEQPQEPVSTSKPEDKKPEESKPEDTSESSKPGNEATGHNPKNVTVTADDKSKVYGQLDPEFTAVVSGAHNEHVINYNIGRVDGDSDNAGTHTIDVYGRTKQGNYIVNFVDGTLTIRPQSINPEDADYIGVMMDAPEDCEYDGQPHKWEPIITGAKERNSAKSQYSFRLLKEGVDYTVSYSTDDFTNAGDEVVVTIRGKGNYTGTIVRSYTILPGECVQPEQPDSDDIGFNPDATVEEPSLDDKVAAANKPDKSESKSEPEAKAEEKADKSEPSKDDTTEESVAEEPQNNGILYDIAETVDEIINGEEPETPDSTVDKEALEKARMARINRIYRVFPISGMVIVAAAVGTILFRRRR